jgi:hypothetical protein
MNVIDEWLARRFLKHRRVNAVNLPTYQFIPSNQRTFLYDFVEITVGSDALYVSRFRQFTDTQYEVYSVPYADPDLYTKVWNLFKRCWRHAQDEWKHGPSQSGESL